MLNLSRDIKRILMVEDDEEAWEIVSFDLTEYKLIYARDLDEGLRLARLRYFDLYILDNWLPDGSGVELCRLIRKFDPNTPILFYSGAGYARDIQEALLAGAQSYLIKPVNPDELEREVAQLFSIAAERKFEARLAEMIAVQEELAIRQTENAERLENARAKYLRSREKALRLKAERAFLTAGGTRGDFARRWPSVYIEEVRNHRN
jgi:DNA-binding response OmpR family regulator